MVFNTIRCWLARVRDLIHDIAREVGIRGPKLWVYANTIGVAFRNQDGDRVLVTIPHDASRQAIRDSLVLGLRARPEAGAVTTAAMLQRISE
jgi:hypothetical protein